MRLGWLKLKLSCKVPVFGFATFFNVKGKKLDKFINCFKMDIFIIPLRLAMVSTSMRKDLINN